jgi:hypothetical protein
MQSDYNSFHKMADQGDENAREWVKSFKFVADGLSVRVLPDQQ